MVGNARPYLWLGVVEKVATWRVASGGRIGMVIGEDAVEGGCKP
jgi:hypothetical protein